VAGVKLSPTSIVSLLRRALLMLVAAGSLVVFATPNASAQDLTDQIPAEVLAELEAREPDIVAGLRDGSLEEIPQSVVDALPQGLKARVPTDLIAGTSGTFIAILIIVGVLAIAGFLYGMMKAAIKAALFFGVVAAIAFFLLFTL